ncbi:RNA methyltransferase tRNA(m5U54)methyltransferase [Ascosphaera pollenicola]|nr:RNA methyltransferase tRNA(m5U54)methyltransferase [Ascosphaera pollenicola]
MHHAHTHQHAVPLHPRFHVASRHFNKINPRSPADDTNPSSSTIAASSDSASNDDHSNGGLSPSAVDALIALLVLILVSIVAVGTLLLLKHRKNTQTHSRSNSTSKGSRRSSSSSDGTKGELPLYADIVSEKNGRQSQDKEKRSTVTISATNGRLQKESTYYLNENRNSARSDSPPPSDVPEIRITFPEEEDDQGKRVSGRVVVVRIGESGGIGLEPLDEKKEIEMHGNRYEEKDFEKEGLPAYENSRLESLDLDRMGGLKEKEDV